MGRACLLAGFRHGKPFDVPGPALTKALCKNNFSSGDMRPNGVVPLGQHRARLQPDSVPSLPASPCIPWDTRVVSRRARQWKPLAERVRRM